MSWFSLFTPDYDVSDIIDDLTARRDVRVKEHVVKLQDFVEIFMQYVKKNAEIPAAPVKEETTQKVLFSLNM